jgi:pimeloyl-ACP methyl ester carboxylesterase
VRRWLRISLLGAVTLLVVAVAALVAFVHSSSPPKPGAFYTPPTPLPSAPLGTIVRSQRLASAPDGALGWKLLYMSQSYRGAPTAVSGLLFVPPGPAPAAGRNIVAITHGTLGIASNCGPSNTPTVWPAILDGLAQFLAAGDAVVVPDYEGLGTTGPHPYLVGASEARAALDEVRAAHLFPDASGSTRFVVWGVSQGGQAALFTGQLAASYAPELKLVAVAAGAPASELAALLKLNRDTPFGRVLSAYAIDSWARVYPGVSVDQVVTKIAQPLVTQIGRICLNEQNGVIAAGLVATLLRLSYLRAPPWETEPWKELLDQNTPGDTRIPAPILIVQGAADELVRPAITAAFVKTLCTSGDMVEYRTYSGVGHLAIGPDAARAVASWIQDRFAGLAARSTCH